MMVVQASKGREVCDVVIDTMSVLYQLRERWKLECGQKIHQSVGKCGYWQEPYVNWEMKNIRLATKEEIAESETIEKMIKLTQKLYE